MSENNLFLDLVENQIDCNIMPKIDKVCQLLDLLEFQETEETLNEISDICVSITCDIQMLDMYLKRDNWSIRCFQKEIDIKKSEMEQAKKELDLRLRTLLPRLI